MSSSASIIRVAESERVRPLHVAVACVAVAALVGSFLLTTGPHGTMEGAKDWHEESALRAIVHVLNLGYGQTTSRAIEIKWLVFALATGIVSVAIGVALLSKPKVETTATGDTVVGDEAPDNATSLTKRQIPPLAAAQVALVLYAVWSFASALWSHAPDMAVGGSVLLAIGVVWAVALGRVLETRTALAVAFGLILVGAVASLLAIAYHDIRNPVQRVGYPIGNPLFLAACLLPTLIGGVHLVWTFCRHDVTRTTVGRFGMAIAAVVVVIIVLYALRYTGSRSAIAAALFGFISLCFFECSRRGRIITIIVAACVAILGIRYMQTAMTTPSDTGRDATLRTRLYAWSYAQDLISERIILGHGQGGYTLLADPLARDDVLADPLPLQTRLAHAHNEWLEVWADLGIVGLALVLSAMGLTLIAGYRALPNMDNKLKRGMLITLMAVLIALIVEECADNALRVAGLPIVFYTVIGLIWALARESGTDEVHRVVPLGMPRPVAGLIAIIVGIAVAGAGVVDFQAARDQFEIETALLQKDGARVERMAVRATSGRLSPQRRLEAIERRCAAELQMAQDHQAAYAARLPMLAERPDDPALLQAIDRDRKACVRYIERAGESLTMLSEKSPEFFASGWRGYQVHMTTVYLARDFGNEEIAEQNRVAAFQWLERDIQRRPFEPFVAVNYVSIATDRLSVPEIVTYLARPLRYHPLPAEYTSFLATIGGDPLWQQQIPQIADDAAGVENLEDAEQPWAAETLRLIADLYMISRRPALAAQLAEKAVEQYRSINTVGLIGSGAAMAELADYQYFANPANAAESLKLADRAIQQLPNSTPGRRLKRAIESRAVAFALAAGDEADAKTRMKVVAPDRREENADADVAAAYASMTRNLLRQSPDNASPLLDRWMERAIELTPDSALVRWVHAQLRFARDDLDGMIASLRKSLQLGGSREDIANLAREVSIAHPEHEALAAFVMELIGQTPESAPASEEPVTLPAP